MRTGGKEEFRGAGNAPISNQPPSLFPEAFTRQQFHGYHMPDMGNGCGASYSLQLQQGHQPNPSIGYKLCPGSSGRDRVEGVGTERSMSDMVLVYIHTGRSGRCGKLKTLKNEI